MQYNSSVRQQILLGFGGVILVMAAAVATVIVNAPAGGPDSTAWIALGAAVVVSIALGVFISARVARPVRKIITLLDALERGDLGDDSVQAGAADGEFGAVVDHVLQMRAKLRLLVSEVQQSAQDATDAAHMLAGMTEQVTSSVQQQADSTREAAATIEEMTVSINQVANSSGKASRMAKEAGETASERVQDVMRSSEQMRFVADKVQETSQRIEALTGQVEKIGNIVGVIVNVADQTNLLALNAAIEAARAGEFGRGFAVVADEVRKLAERSAVSAQEITAMINTIQSDAGTVVESMQQSLESVLNVSQGAEQSAESMQGIQQSSLSVVKSIESINGTLREQRMASVDLAQKVEYAAKMAESNIETVNQLRTTSSALLELANKLNLRAADFSHA
jgi:methyl-accepting chemotaxis protein